MRDARRASARASVRRAAACAVIARHARSIIAQRITHTLAHYTEKPGARSQLGTSDRPRVVMLFRVHLHSVCGHSLQSMDVHNGLSDPYVKIDFGGLRQFETPPIYEGALGALAQSRAWCLHAALAGRSSVWRVPVHE